MPYVNGFLPSRSAPLFHNGPWPSGLDLSLSLAGLPAASVDVTQMGLCGGLAFLARDIHESGTPQLRSTDARSIPVALGRHIRSRLIDSFLGSGTVAHWLRATREPDHAPSFWGRGLHAQTVEAAHQVMRFVDAGGLVPVGVVLARSPWPWAVFQNHVELVYGYDLVGSRLTLHVYDSNAEGSDHVVIELDVGPGAPVQPITTNGTSTPGQTGRIRGFFVLPYAHRDPSPAYIDDGRLTLDGALPSDLAVGDQVTFTVTVDNTGSTTFDPRAGYRLGLAPGSTGWAPHRFDLPVPLDPGRTTTLAVTLSLVDAGAARSPLRLLRETGEGVTWFGRPTPPVTGPVREPVA